MSKENILITEFDFKLIANFFKGLNRQGPGSNEDTLKALSFIPKFSHTAKIADIGCGTGQQTVILAKNMNCYITAIDLLPEMIDGVRQRMESEGLSSIVSTFQASMDGLPFQDKEFDIIWAEGSIYNIGFENGLRKWRKLLKKDGFIAVTECSWLKTARPKDSRWLTENVPEIDSIANKIQVMTEAGYEPIAHFILPEKCWTDNYYAPMKIRMQEFLKENGNSVAAQNFIGRMHDEIAYYNKNKAYFGYVFYIGQKTD